MIDPDDPDQLLNIFISVMGEINPSMKEHFIVCKQCRSILFGSIKLAIDKMIQDPVLVRGFQEAAKHVRDVGHGFEK